MSTTTTTTTRNGNKMPIFHKLTTKRNAVRRINAAVKRGSTRTTAVNKETKILGVHYKTIENWLIDPNINKSVAAKLRYQKELKKVNIHGVSVSTDTTELDNLLKDPNTNVIEITGKSIKNDVTLITHMTLKLENGSYNRYTQTDIKNILNSEELQAWVK